MGFSESLRHHMVQNDLKQADLCRMTQIQTSLMSEYLSGKKSPAIANAIAIADALGISLDELVGGRATPPPSGPVSTLDELLQLARTLPPAQQAVLLDVANALQKRLCGAEYAQR